MAVITKRYEVVIQKKEYWVEISDQKIPYLESCSLKWVLERSDPATFFKDSLEFDLFDLDLFNLEVSRYTDKSGWIDSLRFPLMFVFR